MIAPSCSSSTVRATHTGRLRRTYVFAVSALAAFVVALAVQRDMGCDYQTTARLSAGETPTASVPRSAKELRELESLITASETIRQAAREAGIRLQDQDDVHQAEPAMPTVADIRRQLTAERIKTPQDCVELSVALTGADEKLSIQMVNAVARQAAQLQQMSTRSRSEAQKAADTAEKAARAAAQDWAEARRKRDTFVAANERLLAAATEPVPPAVPQPPPQPVPTVNNATRQRIAELTSRLQAQEVVRKQLLAKMTPEHPHYQLMRDQIAQLQAEIDDANRSLIPTEPALPAVTADPTALSERSSPPQGQSALLAELGRLEQHVVALRQQQETLVRAATEARRLAESQVPAETWTVHPADSARRINRPTSVPGVLLSLAIGILAGSATLLIGGAIRTISQASDIEALGVRLLGTLPDQADVMAGASRLRHGPSRWVLWASEATLLLFLAAMVLVAFKNHDFARQIAADPLSGLAEGVRRLPSLFGGPVI